MRSRPNGSRRRRAAGPRLLPRWLRRTRKTVLWSFVLSLATYAGYRILSRPFRPVNHRLALFLGRRLLEASGPCLAVTSRPLELERLAGGTLRRMVLANVPVVMVVVTAADEVDERLEAQDNEALEAAHRIGYHRLQMLKVPGPIQVRDLEHRLEGVWAEVEPEVVVAFDPLDPLGRVVLREERLCGEAVLRLAERLDREQRVKLVFCGSRRPNALVEVTPILSDKIGAVLSHRTELALPDPVVNLGLRLAARLPDLRGSFEALRILEPARRTTVRKALARRHPGQADPSAGVEAGPPVEPRRARVRTRIPAAIGSDPPEAGTHYWATDGSAPERVGASGRGAPVDPES